MTGLVRAQTARRSQTVPTRNCPKASGLEDFVAYMPMHGYIFMPAREMWPAGSVNARLPLVPFFKKNGGPLLNKEGEQKYMAPSTWLDKNAPVEQMTWHPGLPELIRDRLVAEGGWIERRGVTVLNLYRPPMLIHGDAMKAGPWLAHVKTVYPDDIEHILNWLAHRVQRPGEKLNHALELGGVPGIGKDTLLEPVRQTVAPWNFQEANPTQIQSRFNSFIKGVILRESEARDLGEYDRYAFYEHMKTLIAVPPDGLRCDEKHLREHAVFNVCGVVIATNHLTDGIYLPPDDRRHYVAWSPRVLADFTEKYWPDLWGFYHAGGFGHVAAYLAARDLSSFDPKAPPPKTAAFWTIVDANRAPEDAELADVLDGMGNPAATTLAVLIRESAGREIQELA